MRLRATEADGKAQIQVLARAAAILRTLEDEDAGLSLGQIAARVNLPRSTVQRIVAALEAETFLIPASAAGGVRLGPALMRLAASVNTGVSAIARPLLLALSEELMETVDISVPRKDQVVFVDQVIGNQRLRTVSAVGEAFALHCTANGKVFLAHLDDQDIVRRIGRVYERRTPTTHVSFDALMVDIEQIRRQGYAIDHQEHAPGISAAGVLLTDTFGSPLMVSVPVPSARFDARQDFIIDKLLAMRARLQERFGAGV
jgi:DNA-binding IclR family transcriptional regulator